MIPATGTRRRSPPRPQAEDQPVPDNGPESVPCGRQAVAAGWHGRQPIAALGVGRRFSHETRIDVPERDRRVRQRAALAVPSRTEDDGAVTLGKSRCGDR